MAKARFLPVIALFALMAWLLGRNDAVAIPHSAETAHDLRTGTFQRRDSSAARGTFETHKTGDDRSAPLGSSTEAAFVISADERERIARDRAEYRALKSASPRTELQESLLQAIERSSRYPAHNQTFASAEVDPVLRNRTPEKRQAQRADGTTLQVSCDRKQYDPGSTVVVRAIALRGDPNGVAKQLPFDAGMRADLRRADGNMISALEMQPEQDGSFVARVSTSKGTGSEFTTGVYEVRVATSDGLSEVAMFMLRPAYARLTGGYRERLEGGALIIEAQVEAFETANYYAFASLYAAGGVPVGSVEVTQRLETGSNWLPLRFHGLMMHDAGRDGPYVLRHIQVSRREVPIWEGVAADPNFETQPYQLKEFSSEPYFRLDVSDDER